MAENYSRRYEDQFQRFKEKQGLTKEEKSNASNNSGSRYLEYRKREQIEVDKM
jgi:hypothetical protein